MFFLWNIIGMCKTSPQSSNFAVLKEVAPETFSSPRDKNKFSTFNFPPLDAGCHFTQRWWVLHSTPYLAAHDLNHGFLNIKSVTVLSSLCEFEVKITSKVKRETSNTKENVVYIRKVFSFILWKTRKGWRGGKRQGESNLLASRVCVCVFKALFQALGEGPFQKGGASDRAFTVYRTIGWSSVPQRRYKDGTITGEISYLWQEM